MDGGGGLRRRGEGVVAERVARVMRNRLGSTSPHRPRLLSDRIENYVIGPLSPGGLKSA